MSEIKHPANGLQLIKTANTRGRRSAADKIAVKVGVDASVSTYRVARAVLSFGEFREVFYIPVDEPTELDPLTRDERVDLAIKRFAQSVAENVGDIDEDTAHGRSS